MGWSINKLGHLDLSGCFMAHGYDMFAVEKLAREYYAAELTELVAWDGLEIRGMTSERKFLHLIRRHGHGEPPLNALMDIDLRRVECLPILKLAVTGKLPVNVYRQEGKRGKIDKVEVVVKGLDANYIVVLGCFKDHYIVRSAYPANKTYVEKIRKNGTLIEDIRPNDNREAMQ